MLGKEFSTNSIKKVAVVGKDAIQFWLIVVVSLKRNLPIAIHGIKPMKNSYHDTIFTRLCSGQ